MNYIKHLTGFFEKVANDRALNPTHVSLYMAMFQFWNCNRFKNPISISRDEVMRISKISSKSTYHKCLKKLHYLGYICYEPSYNPFKGSHVFLFNFSDDLKPIPKSEKETTPKIEHDNGQVSGQVVDKLWTSIGTSSGQALVPSINYINNTNNSNILKLENKSELKKKLEDENLFFKNDDDQKQIPESLAAHYKTEKEKSSAKKEMFSTFADTNKKQAEESRQKGFINPTFEQVKTYFLKNNFPELEAYKFYNYFASIGWLVGGKIPMIDWHAAAQNWILNTSKFNNHEPHNLAAHLNTNTEKNYDEPL